MTKQELVDKVSEGVEGISKREVSDLVQRVFDTIQETVAKEERFAYPGFGAFVLRHRKARDGRNPQTGEKIRIKASKTVAFRPAGAFKDSL